MKHNDLRRWLALAAVVCVVCTACDQRRTPPAATSEPEQPPAESRLELDTDAKSGTPHADQNEAEAPDAGSFRIVLNQQPTVLAGQSACNILAENPAENHYDLRVCLYLQEDGALLGTTPRIGRGQNVEMLALEPLPAPGEHPALALLELYDESDQPVSTLQMEVTLVVQGESTAQPDPQTENPDF